MSAWQPQYALAKFADQRSGLRFAVKISPLFRRNPILQVTLINILVERKERSAIGPIQQIHY